MTAPRIAQYQDLRTELSGLPAIWQAAADAIFVVLSGGEFGGQRYRQGDVLICRGEALPDEPVVLMARGHGRPRMGWIRGEELFGEVGEPCSAARWRPAGRIVAVLQGDARSLAVVRSAPQVVSMPEMAQTRRARSVPATGQLSLFAA